MKKSFIFGLSVILFCLTSASFADTRYISDKIYVPLRVGDGSKYRIIHRGLPSGEKLELISTNEDSGYSKVRTDKGVEGWLPSHYLISSPAARSQLAANKKQIDELSGINKELQKNWKTPPKAARKPIASLKSFNLKINH